MPDNKDFLEQFSDAGKPASFKEEERIPVVKQKKPLNVKALIIAAVILLVLAIGAYFLFFAPKIEMPNFVGQSKNDVAAWVKQQGIEASGIVFSDEYNFDNSEGTILTQSIPAGKKVKNNVKLNFTLSLGPDPEEKISVPDLQSMEKEDIQDWISKNKLLKTKISTAYNDNVAENNVIDYSFSGCEEDTFTRGCTLKINVSKGSAPAGQVTVEDFVKKSYETAEAWAKSKKINLEKVEQYSDKVDSGLVISQSIASGKTLKEGETLVVYVSLGKAVYMPNMVGWSEGELGAWKKTNPNVEITTEEDYSSYEKGTVIEQSIAAGTLLKESDFVKLYISKGNVVEFENYVGHDYHEPNGLHDAKDKAILEGAGISLNKTFEFSDTIPVNYIISHDTRVMVGGVLNICISRGKNILLTDLDNFITWSELVNGIKTKTEIIDDRVTEEEARAMLDKYKENEKTVNYHVEYVNSEDSEIDTGDVIKSERSDGIELNAGTYMPQDQHVIVYVKMN